MPHAILIPAITYAAPALLGGAATYGVAAKQASAQKKAAEANKASTDAALEFEQKKYADSQARDQRSWDDYQQRRANYDAARRSILAKYGINTGGGPGGGDGAAGITIPGVGGRQTQPQLQLAAGSGGGGTPLAPQAGGGDPSAMLFGGDGDGGDMDPMAAMGEDPLAGGGAPMEAVNDQLKSPDDWTNWGAYGVR